MTAHLSEATLSSFIFCATAVRGTPTECAARLQEEYGALADRMSLTTHNASVEALGQMAAALRDLG